MKRTISGCLVLIFGCGVAFGGEVVNEKQVKELEKMIEEGGIYVETAKKGVVLSGYVDASYSYNMNGGGTDEGLNGTPGSIRTHMFDVDSNDFNVNQVKLALEKALPEENTWAAGFRVDLMFGEDAKYLWDNDDGMGDGELAVEQAYVQFRAPLGNGLDFKFGKFVSLLGYETIETPANLNVSRSYWFTYGIPWMHTGFLMAYKFNDMVDVKLGLVNGWNNSDSNFLDGNDTVGYVSVVNPDDVEIIRINGENGDDGPADFAKAITAQIALHALGGNADLVNSFMYSFEGEDGFPGGVNGANLSSRHNQIETWDPEEPNGPTLLWENSLDPENEGVFVWDIWGQWRPKACGDKLLLAFNAGIGHAYGTGSHGSWETGDSDGDGEADIFGLYRVGEGDNSSTWWGMALYAKYQVTDVFSLAVRGEYFHEDDSVARGLYDAIIVSGDGDYDSVDYSDAAMYCTGTDAWSLTTTLGFDLWENMLARIEYRMDLISSDGGAGAEEMDDADDLDEINAFTNNRATQHTFILNFSYSF